MFQEKVLLEERRSMTFSERPHAYAIDFTFDLIAGDKKVMFGDTKEGMFAIRAADWMREDFRARIGVIGISGTGKGKYLSSNGDEGHANVWGKRAKWVSLYATSPDGKPVGIAIFNHPSSVNYPTYWHARGYGLFSANPLGQGVFEKTRNPAAIDAKPLNLTLQPGESAHFRFCLLVFDGRKSREELEQEFEDFAQ